MADAAPPDPLGAWIRDPDANPPPAGVDPRRLRVHAELVRRNLDGLLASAFPVIRRTLAEDEWNPLVEGFLREHPARTPLFPEIAGEMLRYLDARAASGRGDPGWLAELAHYEWVEFALQVSEARPADAPPDPDGDMLGAAPVLSPLVWPLAYAWPVHRIGPAFRPDEPPAAPTLLLVRRLPGDDVAFSELSPLAFRLLERIGDMPGRSGREHLRALAAEAGAGDVDAFIADGRRMLEAWREDGTLSGTPATE